MIDKNQVKELFDYLINNRKGYHLELALLVEQVGLTRYASSKIHQNMTTQDSTLFIRVSKDGKVGTTSTNSLKPEQTLASVDKAIQIANNAPIVEGFPAPVKHDNFASVNAYYKQTAEYGPIERAKVVASMIEKVKKHKLDLAGSYATSSGGLYVGNSAGLFAYHPSTAATIKTIVMGPDSSGYAQGWSRNIDEIDAAKVIDRAIDKCLKAANPQEIPVGKYNVLLEPSAVEELVSWMNYVGFASWTFDDSTSFMADRIGQQITGDKITIYDDPHQSYTAMPFDLEGFPRKKVTFIDKGIVKDRVYNHYLATKHKTESTGHSIGFDGLDKAMPLTLSMEPGTKSAEVMLDSMKDGILITRFHYVNGLLDTRQALFTGMTRDGTFRIKNGKIEHGIKNLRFTESMLEAFKRVIAISKERELISGGWDFSGGSNLPYILIEDFNFSSGSKHG